MSRLFLEDFFLTVPLKVCDKTSKLVRMEWKKLSRLEEENPIIISYLPTPQSEYLQFVQFLLAVKEFLFSSSPIQHKKHSNISFVVSIHSSFIANL